MLIPIILSCNGQKKMAAQTKGNADDILTLIAQDNYSGADSTETMVITNAKALKSFYSRVNRTRKPGLPVPSVDFSKEIVVVLCSSEEVDNQNYGLTILKESDDYMIIGKLPTIEKEGHMNSPNSTTLVNPFFVYKMPLTDKKVSFEMIE
jgi:hypothetical protein